MDTASTFYLSFIGLEEHWKKAALPLQLDHIGDGDCVGFSTLATRLCNNLKVWVLNDRSINIVGVGRR